MPEFPQPWQVDVMKKRKKHREVKIFHRYFHPWMKSGKGCGVLEAWEFQQRFEGFGFGDDDWDWGEGSSGGEGSSEDEGGGGDGGGGGGGRGCSLAPLWRIRV